MAKKLSYAPRTLEEWEKVHRAVRAEHLAKINELYETSVAPKHEQETTAQESTSEEDTDPHAADARLLAFLERDVGSRRQVA